MSKKADQIGLNLTTAEHGKEIRRVPPFCPLEGLKETSPSLQGVELATLERFDTIIFRTANTLYRMFLLDPETGRALLEGGRQITEPVEVMVVGSSSGCSIQRTGWIGVGLRVEAWVNDSYLRTSPVQSLCVKREGSPETASMTEWHLVTTDTET
jgi:hypothetical protein